MLTLSKTMNMKRIVLLIVFISTVCFSAMAQERMSYIDSVKAHLSAAGRKSWKPEFSFRLNELFLTGSFDVTGGIRTSANKVFGLGVGYSIVSYDSAPVTNTRLLFYLYHRHYLPLGEKKRFSLYSDIMGGGTYVIQTTNSDPSSRGRIPEVGALGWYFSWQPGVSLRLGQGKANIFIGPTLGPTFGAHVGFAL